VPLKERWPYPFWIAHRGGGRLAPENTLAALRAGRARGYRFAELDVTLSADGVPFLLHDERLERTTDGRGVAAARSWGELEQLDAGGWFGAAHRGEPLATLDAALDEALALDLLLNLELKPGGGDARRLGATVGRRVAERWPADRTPAPLLSSFDAAAVAAAGAAAPGVPRALLFETPPARAVDEALALGCRAIGASHEALDRATIDAAHAAGLAVLAYTVDDAGEAERLRTAGIDGLFTDALDRFDPHG
jgi:glycerophosphoryl diester phosphodiesterase